MKLYYSNKSIKFINDIITKHNSNITDLAIPWNEFSDIKLLNLNQLSNCTRISLAYNEIQSLPQDIITYLPPSLIELDLSYNKIKNLSNIRFPLNIKKLNLCFNEIHTIDNFVPPYSLSYLELKGNPLFALYTPDTFILKYLNTKRELLDLKIHHYYAPPSNGGPGYLITKEHFNLTKENN